MKFGITIAAQSPSEYGFKKGGDNMIPAYISIILKSYKFTISQVQFYIT
jgi:hypothetical protein